VREDEHFPFTNHESGWILAFQVGILPTPLVVKFAPSLLVKPLLLIGPLTTFGWRNLCFG
jgi:hypothetical protein